MDRVLLTVSTFKDAILATGTGWSIKGLCTSRLSGNACITRTELINDALHMQNVCHFQTSIDPLQASLQSQRLWNSITCLKCPNEQAGACWSLHEAQHAAIVEFVQYSPLKATQRDQGQPKKGGQVCPRYTAEHIISILHPQDQDGIQLATLYHKPQPASFACPRQILQSICTWLPGCPGDQQCQCNMLGWVQHKSSQL